MCRNHRSHLVGPCRLWFTLTDGSSWFHPPYTALLVFMVEDSNKYNGQGHSPYGSSYNADLTMGRK